LREGKLNESTAAAIVAPESITDEGTDRDKAVSTHVLVEEEKVHKLRELSKRTRVHQSEYLREAVDDLLTKYGPDKAGSEE
jgi:hypothetical protein